MEKKLKEKWVKALRSGKYAQTRAWLKVTKPSMRKAEYKEKDGLQVNVPAPVGYCCLGVLCDITGTSTAGKLPSVASSRSWGLDSTTITKLTTLNDDDHKSFKHIAAWIEKHL